MVLPVRSSGRASGPVLAVKHAKNPLQNASAFGPGIVGPDFGPFTQVPAQTGQKLSPEARPHTGRLSFRRSAVPAETRQLLGCLNSAAALQGRARAAPEVALAGHLCCYV